MRIAAVLFLALASLAVRADDIVGVDMTGEFQDPFAPCDILFQYDLTTNTIMNLFVEGPPDCSGTNPLLKYTTFLNGSNLQIDGTESFSNCKTIAFSGGVLLSDAGGENFGGATARYVQSTAVSEPGTLPLMMVTFAGLGLIARRRLRRQ